MNINIENKDRGKIEWRESKLSFNCCLGILSRNSGNLKFHNKPIEKGLRQALKPFSQGLP